MDVNTRTELVVSNDRSHGDGTDHQTVQVSPERQARRHNVENPPAEMILRNIQSAVIVTDLAGAVIYWNEAAEDVFGYPASEMLGNTLEVLYPDQDPAELATDLAKIFAGQDYVGEWHGRRRDGTPVYVEIRTSLMRDAAGEPAGFIGVSSDVTQRKLAQLALEQQETRLRALEESNVIGIITADRESIVAANDFFLRMVGYSIEDIQRGDVRWPDMTPTEYVDVDARGLEELIATGICRPFEKEYIRKDGTRVPILLGAVRIQTDPLLWVCFVLDLSAQKRLEEERSEILFREKAARQRLQDFLAIIAHELAQPLTAIHGNTQIAYRRLSKTAPREAQRLKSIEEAAGRMQRLVFDLRDASFIGTGRFSIERKTVDLVDVVNHVIAQRRASSPSRTITVEAPDHISGVWDPDRIAQLVSNLVGNAIKYSPQDRPIKVTAEESGDTAIIRVRDEGPGITPEQQQSLFEPFSRLETAIGSGSGLGLYICKGIAEAHDGSIQIESEPGEGSSFVVSLPRGLE